MKSPIRHLLSKQTTLTAADRLVAEQLQEPIESAGGTRRPWARAVAQMMIVLQILQTALVAAPANAQVVAAGNAPAGQKPLVDAAANGVPILLIAPPSAAGVSHNRYDQFNVGKQGLILNNSRDATSTQLGGIVNGNMQLGTTTARIILNEVTSGNPSRLNGYIEVAGQRADLVIANPNGISCDGCGFLNTAGRATLSTGTPTYNSAGQLEGLNVQRGVITIGAGGLNASNMEQLDLLARGIVIEGEISTKNLQAVLGANKVLYGTLKATQQDGSGAAPRFAIDIAELGGMYANQIYLVATDKGLGVNSAGRIASLAENLTLSAQGDLTLKDNYSKKDVLLASTGKVTLTGQTNADQNVRIAAPDSIAIAKGGVLRAEQGVLLETRQIDNSGSVIQKSAGQALVLAAERINSSGSIYSATDLNLQAATIDGSGGVLQAERGLNITAGSIAVDRQQWAANEAVTVKAGALRAANGVLSAGTNLSLDAAGLLDVQGSKLSAAKSAELRGQGVLSAGATVTAASVMLDAGKGKLDNTGGVLYATEAMQVRAAGVDNTRGKIVATGKLALDVGGGALDNTGGTVAADNAAFVNVGSIRNREGTVSTSSDLVLDGAVDNNKGKLITTGAFTFAGRAFDNAGGAIQAGNAVSLDASGTIDSAGGVIQSTGSNVIIKADRLDNTKGAIGALGDIAIGARSLLGAGGEASAGGKLALTGASLDLAGAKLASNGTLDLAASDIVATAATMQTGQALAIKANSLSGAGASIASVKTVELAIAGDATLDKASVAANGNVSLASRNLNAQQLRVDSGANLALKAGSVDLRDASLSGARGVTLDTGNLLMQGGSAVSGGKLTITGQSQQGGKLSAAGDVDITMEKRLDLAGGAILAGGDIAARAQGIVTDKAQVGGKHIVLDAGLESLSNVQGTIVAESGGATGKPALVVRGNGIDNSGGALSADANAVFDAKNQVFNNTGGNIVVAGNMELNTGALKNRLGSVATGSSIVMRGNDVDNTDGQLRSGKDVIIESSGKRFVNQRGLVEAQGAMTLNAAELSNNGGKLAANQTLALAAGTLDNSGGTVAAGKDLSLSVSGAITSTNGNLRAGGPLSISTERLDAAGALISSQAQIVIAAGQGIKLDNGEIKAGGNITLAADSVQANRASITGNGAIAIDGRDSVNLAGADINANGAVTVKAANSASLAGTQVASNAALQVSAASIDAGASRLSSAGELSLQASAGGIALADSVLASGARLHIDGTGIDAANATLAAKGNIVLDTRGEDYKASGSLHRSETGGITIKANNILAGGTSGQVLHQGFIANGDIALEASGQIDASNSSVSSGNNVVLNAGKGISTAGGALSAGGSATLSGSTINNAGGAMAANGALTMVAREGGIDNGGGSILAREQLTLQTRTGLDRIAGKPVAPGGATDLNNKGGSIVGVGAALINSGSIDNSGGKIASGNSLVLDLGNSDLRGAKGSLLSENALTLSARQVDVSGGQVRAGKGVTISAEQIVAQGAAISAAGGDLLIDSKGSSVDASKSVMLASSLLSLKTGAANLAQANLSSGAGTTIASAALDARQATIQAGGDIVIGSAALNAQDGSIGAGGKLAVSASTITGGQYSAFKDLSVVSTGGIDLGKSALPGAQGGAFLTDAALSVKSQGLILDDGRAIGKNVTLDVGNGALSNRGGTILATDSAANAPALTLTSNGLDSTGGSIVSNGDLVINSGSGLLDNSKGSIGAMRTLDVKAGNVGNAGGSMVANTALAMQVQALDNQAGKIQAGTSLNLKAADIDNRAGTLAGGSGIELTAGKVDNSAKALIGSNGNVTLHTKGLNNNDSQVSAGGKLAIDTGPAGAIGNVKGRLASDGGMTLASAGDVDNSGGAIAAGEGLDAQIGGALVNKGGNIVAGKQVGLTVKGLVANQGGAIQAGGDMLLSSTKGIDNDAGKLIANGALAIDGASLTTKKGLVSAGKDLTLDVKTLGGALDNAGGQIQASGKASIAAKGVGNVGGILIANGELVLDTGKALLDNRGGIAQSAKASVAIDAGDIASDGADSAIMAATDLTIAGGNIDSGKGLISAGKDLSLIAQGALNNAQGRITAGAHATVQGKGIDNNAALLSAGKTLTVQAGSGTLVNSGGNILAGDTLKLGAATVQNLGGTLASNGDLIVATDNSGVLDNSAGTIRSAQGNVSVTGGQVRNGAIGSGTPAVGGLIAAEKDVTIVANGAVLNRDGRILAANKLTLQASGALDNNNGELTGATALGVVANGITSAGGSMLSNGELTANAGTGAFDNRKGVISGGGTTKLNSTGKFDNTDGKITTGANLAATTGAFDNVGGLVSAQGGASLTTAAFDGRKGEVIGQQALSINTQGARFDGSGARFASNGDVTLTTGEAVLTGSTIAAGDSFGIASSGANARLDADGIKIAVTKNITMTGADVALNGSNLQAGNTITVGGVNVGLNNAALAANMAVNISGTDVQAVAIDISTQGDISLQAANTLDYRYGQFAAGNNAAIYGGGLVATAGAKLAAGKRLSFGMGQAIDFSTLDFTYQFGTDLLVQAIGIRTGGVAISGDNLFFNAGTGVLDNTAGTLSATGVIDFKARGVINSGGLIAADHLVSLDSGTGAVINDGGTIASAAGKIGIAGSDLLNKNGGNISAAESVNVSTIGLTDNAGGNIVSDGEVSLYSGTLGNVKGNIASNKDKVTVNVRTFDNDGGVVSARTALDVTATLDVSNKGGTLVAGTDATIIAKNGVNNSDSGVIEANDKLVLTSSTGVLINQGGTIQSNKASVDIDAAKGIWNQNGEIYGLTSVQAKTDADLLNMQGGRIASQGEIKLGSLKGKLDNANGVISSGTDLIVAGKDVNNAGGVLSGQKSTKVTADNVDNNAGVIEAGKGGIVITAKSLTNDNSGSARGIVSQGDITISGGSVKQSAGYIGADGKLNIDGTSIDNTGGSTMLAMKELSLTGSVGINNNDGNIKSAVDTTLKAPVLNNIGGTVFAHNNLLVDAAAIDNSNTNNGAFDKGLLASNTVTVNAATVGNVNGAIVALKNLKVTSTASIDNSGGQLSGDAVTIDTADFINTGGRADATTVLTAHMKKFSANGVMASIGTLHLEMDGDYTNLGTVAAENNLEIVLNNGKYTNNGTISAAKDLSLSANELNNYGSISATNTTLNVGSLKNDGSGVINSIGNTTINAANTVNTGRIYGGNVVIAGAVSNEEKATIGARETLTMSGSLINKPDANVISLGNMQLGSVVNAGARIESGGNLDVGNLRNINCVSGSGGNGVGASNCGTYGLQGGVSLTDVTTVTPVNEVILTDTQTNLVHNLNDLVKVYADDTFHYIVPGEEHKIENYIQRTFTTKTTVASVIATSNSGTVTAAGNIYAQAAQNIDSRIVAGGSVLINGGFEVGNGIEKANGDSVNISTQGSQQITNAGSEFESHVDHCKPWQSCKHKRVYGGTSNFDDVGPTTSIDVAGVLYDSGAAAPAPTAPADATIANADPAKVVAVLGTGVINNSPASNGNTAAGDATIVKSGNVVTYQNGSTTVGISVGAINTNTSVQGVAAQGVTAGGAPAVDTTVAAGGTQVGPQVAGSSGGAAPVTTDAQKTGSGGAAGVSVGTSAQPVVAGQVKGNALPGSVIAGNARAAQQTAIGNLTTSFAKFAAARPVVVAEKTVPGVVGSTTKDINGRATDPKVPNVTLTSNADWKAPTGNLFSLKPGEGAGYLVETDPLFTDKNKWTGSDYFLTQLGLDPQRTLKRYGDGFVEQRAFADQLMNITGRNKLSGYDNNEKAFTALMDSGVAYAKQFHLTPGVALSEQQMAQLTTDIVWLQEETVTLPDGSTTKALVPQVYLRRPQQGDLSTGGALIAGDNVTIRNQNGSISNSGTILAGYANAKPTDMHGAATLDARDVTNRGTIAGNVIDIKAGDSIANLGGSLTGLSNTGLNGTTKDDSRITLAGRDITIASTTQTRSVDTVGKNGTSTSSRTNVDRVATIAGGNVRINAEGNFTARGAQIGAGNNLAIFAGKNIDISAVQETHALFVPLGGNVQGRTGYSNESSVSNAGTVLMAGGNVALKAAGDATLSGSNVAAGDSVSIAGTNVTISVVKDRTLIDLQTIRTKGYDRAMNDDESLSGGSVKAGKNVTISATGVASGQKDKDGNVIAQAGTGNLVLNAGTIVAETGVAKLLANNDLTVQAITTQHDSLRESYSKSRTLGGSRMSSSTSTESLQQVTGSRVVGDSVLAEAGKNLTVSGSMIAGVNEVSLKAVAGDVTIKSAEEIYKERNSAEQKTSGFTAGYAGGAASVGYNKSSSSSQSSLDLVSQVGSTIKSTAGKVSVTAGEGIKVVASELDAKTDLSLSGKTVDLLAAQNTSDQHSSYKSASKGISVGVTLDPGAAFSNARKESEKGNSADSGVGKLTKRADGVGEGLLAAIGGVVLQGGSRSAAGTKDHVSSTAQVSTLTAGGNLSIDATGGSITSEGATLKAEGNAALTAKDSIVLDVAHSTESEGQDNKAKGWSVDSRGSLPVGMFNNKDNGKGSADTIRGTTLSVGGNVALKSTDGDIVLTAASVVADKGNVDIAAGRNLTIQSGQDTVSNDNHSNNKAIGKVVVSDTERFAGYNNVKKNGSNDTVTQVQSSVGSINGNITLKAGEKYTQTSSNVLAKNDVSVTAKSIEIGTAANTFDSAQDSSDLKIGGFARISSPLIDLANNRKAAKESDGRLSTMQNMAAAANAYQAASAAGGGSGTLFKAEAGIGIATAKSRDQSSGSKAIGSTLTGTDGNVTLTTTEGDIKATGAGITAGKELKLDSARDIVLQSATSQTSSEGSNNNAGVEVGVGVQVGAKTGTYVYATANVGKGEYDNNATVNTNTKLTGNTVTIASKGDTTLKGAVVKGDSITANVGGKLAIESLQDTNKQHNEQTNAGARVQLSLGTAWEASGNIGHSVADGSSKIVLEQSGLFAGDGGYHVKADSIALKGGAIGSTNAGKSDLTAKAMTFENLANQMDYKAQSVSLSGGFTTGEVKGAAPETQTSTGMRNPNATPGLPMQTKGKDSSTTYATLTDGKINIGGKEMSSAADLGAHTDLATANKAVDPLKDMKAVMAEQKAIGAAGSTLIATGQQINGDIARGAANRLNLAEADVKSSQTEIDRARAVLNDPASTPQQRALATSDIATANRNLAAATTAQDVANTDVKNWGPKGDYSRALTVATGLLVGGLSGQGTGQLAAGASAPYVYKAIGDLAQSNTRPYTDAAELKETTQTKLREESDPAKRAVLEQTLVQADATMLEFKGQYDDWKDGSLYKIALHGAATSILSQVGGGDALQGLLAGGANEAKSPLLEALTKDLDPVSQKFLADLVSVGVGASFGNAQTADLTLSAELNNRQLHEADYARAKRLAKLSNGKYTEEELLNALRWSGVSDGKNLLVEPGHVESYATNPNGTAINLTDPSQGWKPIQTITPGMTFTPIPGDQLVLKEKLPDAPTNAISNFIKSNTGGSGSPYVFAAPAKPASTSGPRFPAPPAGLTRGTVNIDGSMYFPLVAQCPLGCIDPIARYIDDPGTAAYERAMDEKLKRDMVMGGLSLVNPLVRGWGWVAGGASTAPVRFGLAAETGAGKAALGTAVRGAEEVAIVPGLSNATRGVTSAEIDSALGTAVKVKPTTPAVSPSGGRDVVDEFMAGLPADTKNSIGNATTAGGERGSTAMSEAEVLRQNISPCCFAPGTLVATPNGYMAIEALKQGDQVWTRLDDNTGEVFASTVTATHIRDDQPIYRLTLKQDDAGGQTRQEALLVTPGHPFYIEGSGFVSAIDLKAGDRLTARDQSKNGATVTTLELVQQQGRTHNLTVDLGHTFFVGTFETWVHNVGPCARCTNGICTIHTDGVHGGKNVVENPRGPIVMLDDGPTTIKARDPVSLAAQRRLNEIDLDRKAFAPGEAGAAAEMENYLVGTLQRAPGGTSADFIVESGHFAGTRIDFKLTPNTVLQAEKINQFFDKTFPKFSVSIAEKLAKANGVDMMPFDTRFLNEANRKTLLDFVSSLPKSSQKKVIYLEN